MRLPNPIGSGRKARIEMLPLIDIVFLLLVFFLYAMLSMAVHRGLEVDLPGSTSTTLDTKSVLTVTVQADGSIALDQEPVAVDQLTARLLERTSGPTGAELAARGVLLSADQHVPYQELYQVLDRIRQANISRISLQADVEP